MGVRVRIVTSGPNLFPAKLAVPARDCERHHYTIAPLKVTNTLSRVFNDPHEFVSQNVALFHGRDETVIEMQI
jgi:hypothetical protein